MTPARRMTTPVAEGHTGGPMTAEELNAIRARAEAATPGPWRVADEADPDGHVAGNVVTPTDAMILWTRVLCEPNAGFANWPHDMAFIAHARTDLPALLAHVDAVGGERERMADDLDRAIGDLMVVAGERDRARTVTDEMVERAYAAWHAFTPTKDDASGHGAMGAALTAALGGDREGGRG